jgi:regulatory protein
MRVVSIEKLSRGNKFKVCLDGGEEVILSREVLVDYGLRRNDDVSSEILLEIRDSQLYHDAYSAAIRLLNYRMRTRREINERLRQKKFAPHIIDRVLSKLDSLGLVDDSRFAEAFVAEKIQSKPIGKRELERRLHEKGVSKETAAQAVSRLSDEVGQLELALKAAEKKLRSLRGFDSRKKIEKLAAFLARRGFDWDTIRKVVGRTIPEGVHSGKGGIGDEII